MMSTIEKRDNAQELKEAKKKIQKQITANS